MGQGITLDISARITGYQDSLNQLKNAIDKLDPGSRLAKNLISTFQNAQKQVQQLSKNLTPKFTNEAQLASYADKINQVSAEIFSMGEKLQDVSKEDLNFSAIDGLKELQDRAVELSSTLESIYQKAFKDTILASTDLNETLKSIGIDTDKIETEQEVFNALKTKINETSEEMVKFGREYAKAAATRDRINIRIESLQKTIFGTADSTAEKTKEVHNIADSFLNIANLRKQVTQKLKEQFSNRTDLQEIIDKFFDGLDGSTAKAKLQDLMNSLSVSKNKQEFYEKIFGADKTSSGKDINTLLKWLNLPKATDITAALQKYTQELADAPKGISPNSRSKILGFLSSEDINSAVNELLKAISAAYKSVQDEIFKENNNLIATSNTAENAKTALNNSIQQSQQLETTEKEVRNISNSLRDADTANTAIREAREEVQQTTNAVNQMADNGISGLKEVGDSARKASQDFNITHEEIERCNEALEKVQQREQMIGKIEGIAQRWFSMYAAVRMVGNAIKSIISTIKELDKTITDITIVTNMSREDLWGQMPTYTKMAQDYAVSISGVYQVSQLFYQQGLQTNDVLTLTGETLKMARIAGLDYAEATNYMTNALRSFKLDMDEASRVTDVYSVLAASAAVSVSEIAEAMSKTASSAYAVGASLENTATMITVMTEATRESATNIGSALKSIISRYGEMTSDPAKLVDSEGEAMSLNKVDRALQSVGISLQDAQGQFRNFDDVIAELASVWTTLDNNTQRYIATIMAGNRQQSRFLALVSSYDRYAELSEKAANAAGAGEEQFEKTLEGIEARTQQLQTSLQNLYTSAGLQDLYGSLLGIASNVLEYYNNISATFGSGIQGAIAAVVTFGAQFYNVAKIVMTVVKLIKAHYVAAEKEITINQKIEAQIRSGETLSIEEETVRKAVEIYRSGEVDKTNITAKELRKRAEAALKEENKLKNAKTGIKTTGSIAYGIGTAGSLVGTMIGGETGNWISASGNMLGTIGAFASGNYIGGIISAISAITSFASAIDTTSKELKEYNESLEKAKEAQKVYQEAKKKASESKSLITNLDNELEKLDELTIHRYDSVESQEAYQNQLQAIAEAYPELIDYYDAEGKAIDINQQKLKDYREEKEKNAKTDAREAAIKKLSVDEALLELEAMSTPTTAKGVSAGDITDVIDAFKVANFEISNTSFNTVKELKKVINTGKKTLFGSFDHVSEEEIAQWFGISLSSDADIRAALQANNLKLPSITKEWWDISRFYTTDEEQNRQAFSGLWNNFWNYIEQNYSDKDFDKIDFVEAYDNYMKQFAQLTYDSSTSYMRAALVSAQKAMASKTSTSRFQSLTESAVQEFVKTGGYATNLESIFVQNYLENGLSENVLKDVTITSDNWQEYAGKVSEYLNDEKNYPQLSKLFYTGATEENIKKLNEEIVPYITEFSETNLKAKLSKLGIIDTESKEEAYDAITKYWEEQSAYYLELYKNYRDAASEEVKNLLKEDYIKNFSPKFLATFTTELTNITNNKSKLGEEEYNNALSTYSQLWDTLNELAVIAPETFSTIQQLILTKGINSISGIFAIVDALPDFEGKENLTKQLSDLASFIVPNFTVEFDSMTDILTDNFEELTKAISNAQKGMELSEAIKMADKLDISIDKFDKRDGKYYYTNYMDLVDKYLGSQEEIAKYISGEFDITKAAPEEIEAYKRAMAAREQYYSYAREAYISEGRIADFLETFDFSETEVKTLQDQITSGEFNNLPNQLWDYMSNLIDKYKSINNDIYTAFSNSLAKNGVSTVDINDNNEKFLSNWEGKGVTFSQDRTQAIVDFSESTAEDLQIMYYQVMSGAIKLSDADKKAWLKEIDSQLATNNKGAILLDVVKSYSAFDEELAENFAENLFPQLEGGLSELIATGRIVFNEFTRKYSITLAGLQNLVKELKSDSTVDPSTIAAIEDELNNVLTSVADTFAKLVEGSLNSNEAKQTFINALSQLGYDSEKLDSLIYKNANGNWQLAKDAAVDIAFSLAEASTAAGSTAFKAMTEYFTKSGEACSNIFETMASIKRISKENTEEAKKQLTIFERIAAIQMDSPESYNFMSGSLPNALQSPVNFFTNIGTMYTTLDEAAESGYMSMQNFYNVVTAMNGLAAQSGQEINFMGHILNGSMANASETIQAGASAMTITENGAQVSMEKFGNGFKLSVDDMADDVTEGIRSFAQANIDLLDGYINYLEAIVAIQELGEEENQINWDTVFNSTQPDTKEINKATDYANKLIDLANKDQRVAELFKNIKLTEDFSLWNALSNITEIPEDAQQNFQTALNALFASDWDLSSLEAIETRLNALFNPTTGINDKDVEKNIIITIKMGEDSLGVEDIEGLSDFLKNTLDIKENISGAGQILVDDVPYKFDYELSINSDGTRKVKFSLPGYKLPSTWIETSQGSGVNSDGFTVEQFFENLISNWVKQVQPKWEQIDSWAKKFKETRGANESGSGSANVEMSDGTRKSFTYSYVTTTDGSILTCSITLDGTTYEWDQNTDVTTWIEETISGWGVDASPDWNTVEKNLVNQVKNNREGKGEGSISLEDEAPQLFTYHFETSTDGSYKIFTANLPGAEPFIWNSNNGTSLTQEFKKYVERWATSSGIAWDKIKTIQITKSETINPTVTVDDSGNAHITYTKTITREGNTLYTTYLPDDTPVEGSTLEQLEANVRQAYAANGLGNLPKNILITEAAAQITTINDDLGKIKYEKTIGPTGKPVFKAMSPLGGWIISASEDALMDTLKSHYEQAYSIEGYSTTIEGQKVIYTDTENEISYEFNINQDGLEKGITDFNVKKAEYQNKISTLESSINAFKEQLKGYNFSWSKTGNTVTISRHDIANVDYSFKIGDVTNENGEIDETKLANAIQGAIGGLEDAKNYLKGLDSDSNPDNGIQINGETIHLDASTPVEITNEGKFRIGNKLYTPAELAAEYGITDEGQLKKLNVTAKGNAVSIGNVNRGIEYSTSDLELKGIQAEAAEKQAMLLIGLQSLSKQEDIDKLITYYKTLYKSDTTSLMGFKNQDVPLFGKVLFDYVESTGQELESVTEDLSYELSDLGDWGVEGYLQALENADTLTPAQQFILHILQSIQEAQNSGSPAEEFVPYGEAAAEGYALGLKTYDFTNDATAMVDNFEAALKIALENKPLLASLLNSSINFKTSSNLPNQKDTEQQDLFTGNATEDIVDNTETTNSILTDNAASLDSLVRVTNAMFNNLPPEQNPAVWRLAFEGLGVHGDFWGEGNQLVLPDGEGGNAHFNLQDYVRQINELFTSGELENFQVSIPLVLSNTGAFYTEINNAIAKVQNKTINVKVIPDTSEVTNMTFTVNVQGGGEQASQAKGNAQARGTLMGELGPELYVTGGHYYVAGQNGAEFVDLPDDAIVFNHLQTKRLMSTGAAGRGRAVTNEKNATSYATGNVAMASAADTLNRLKEIRSAWQAFLNMSLQDFATKAGGGGGGGGNKSDAAFIGDLERWYNLLRQIEKAEKQINYEEQLRSKIQSDRIINGKALYASQKRQLEALDEEIQHHQELAALQRSYYKERIDDLRTTQFPNIFDYDEEKGLLQFVNGTMANGDKGGLAALADLMATDIHGKPKYTAQEQYEKLLAWGFGEEMKYNDSGELIDVSKDEGYATAVEAFWNRNQSWIEELDELSDSIIEQEEKILDSEEKSNKILQEIVDNQREVEDKILEAIEAREQAVIDKLQDTYDALSDAAEKYVDGLNDALTKEREMYQRQQNDSDLVKLQRRLAILQRSGGSGAEILSLQKQIDSQLQDRYFEQQQSQIDAIKEASDNELEKLQQQIDIATETLEYAKENGLLWREVYDVMARNPEDIVSFITEHSKDWSSKSTLAQSEELRTLTSMIEQWSEYYRDTSATELMGEQGNRSYENWRKANMDKYYDKVWEENKLEAKEIYAKKYAETGDSNKAAVEAEMFLNKKMSEYKAAHPEEFPKEEEPKEEEEKKTGGGDGGLNTFKEVQAKWNEIKYKFNNAVSNYNKTPLGFQNWYDANNKWGITWDNLQEARHKSEFGASVYATAFGEWQAYTNNFEKNRKAQQENITALYNELKRLLNGYPEALKGYKLPVLPTFDTGGMVNETGLALVHAKEGVITPDQVDLLRDLATIQQQLYNSHMLDSIRDNWRHVLNSIDDSANNSITIENATVEMNVQSIANDYDARRAAQMALDEMLAIARKTSVQSIRR